MNVNGKLWGVYHSENERALVSRVIRALRAHSTWRAVEFRRVTYTDRVNEYVPGDAVVIANHTLARYTDATVPFFLVHHGVGSNKNHTYQEKDPKIVAEFMPSAFAVLDAQAHGLPIDRLVPLGYVQMDGFTAHHWRTSPIPKDTVLFAPTWNHEFNNGLAWVMDLLPIVAPMLAQRGMKVVIQMHQYTHIGAVVQVQKVAADFPNVVVTNGNEDLVELFNSAVVLCGDMGSALFEFLPTGRPILAYNSWRWWRDAHGTGMSDIKSKTAFDPEDLSFRWRDAFYQYSDPHAGAWMLEGILDKPVGSDPLYARRLTYADTLFGGTLDGQIAERIAAFILKYMAEHSGG